MKKILGVVAVMFLLVGCGGGKATTNVCKGTVSGIEVQNEFSATGDKVTKNKETATVDFSAANPTDEEIEEFAKLMKDQYKGIDGLTFSYEIKDTSLSYTLETDYEKADLEELVKQKLVEVEKDSSTKYVSLKVTLEGAKKQGFSCTEK